ncbi:MAG: hypothetical protein U0800_23740 [Isosphaeraceae bacterium]
MSEEIDAGAELARRFDQLEPVKAAFWLKGSGSPHRFLYIAPERIDAGDLAAAYGEVLRIVGEMRSPALNPFRIKLIPADDPLAQAAAEIQGRFPGRMPTRLGEGIFGGMGVDDVYVYPSRLPALT